MKYKSTLWVNKWIEVFQKDYFVGVKEPWCRNEGVAILPYVVKNNKYYFLLVKETNPIFKGLNISEYNTITGGLENNDHNTTAEHEMLEEVGINIKNEKVKIYYLGYHFGSKTSTKQWHLYSIDLTNLDLDLTKTYKGTGDNTIGEENISAKFLTENQLIKCNDMYALAIYTKLKFILNNKNMLPENFEDKIKSEEWQKQINQKVKINQLFDDNEVLVDELEEIPLIYAVKNYYFKIVELLLKKGADVDIEDEDENTPLHIAIKNSDFKMIELLLANNADINLKNAEEETPLQIAAFQGDLITISLLLKNNADINVKNIEKQTPLHIAVENSDFKIVELLLANNADINLKNIEGQTPLHIAIKNSDFKIVKLLTKKRKNIEEQNYRITKFLKNDCDQLIENNNFIFNQSKINSIDLQNQPSTSGYKSSSPQM